MKRRRALPTVFMITLLLLGAAVFWHWRAFGGPKTSQRPTTPWRLVAAATEKAAIASITAQLQAFRKDDYRRAVFYQSAALKRNFASVGEFRRMMTRNYPQFAHYKSVSFGPGRSDLTGRHLLIPVVVTGQDGVSVDAMYEMVLENKVYRVASVIGGARPQIKLPPGAGTTV